MGRNKRLITFFYFFPFTLYKASSLVIDYHIPINTLLRYSKTQSQSN